MTTPEPIIEPDLPIIDPHHHLWDRRAMLPLLPDPLSHPFQNVVKLAPRYLIDEMSEDLNAGHNIIATVFVECTSMYRADGPDGLKPVGETEFVNGQAAMSASGLYGETKLNAGIVGHADLMLGAAVGEVLDALIAAGNGRFRGIRHAASYDADANVLGPLARRPQGVFLSPAFRQGFAELGKRGLTFDAWLLEPQLPDLIDLARAFPGVQIVLDHVGTPLGLASYTGKRAERWDIWLENIRTLAKCPNVFVKLGGLAMPFCNFDSCLSKTPAPSSQLAKEWGPYIDACIEAFGARRCMFESNFPVDLVSCTYPTLWNAMKLIAKGASAEEKHHLFFDTANRFYQLGL
jgi:predicted TIM-barrel fold metal-dependent hydrolase